MRKKKILLTHRIQNSTKLSIRIETTSYFAFKLEIIGSHLVVFQSNADDLYIFGNLMTTILFNQVQQCQPWTRVYAILRGVSYNICN